jgi:hypothetical protein
LGLRRSSRDNTGRVGNPTKDFRSRLNFLSISLIVVQDATNMSYDYLASGRSQALYEAWLDKVFQQDVLCEIGLFTKKHRGGVAEKLYNPVAVAFNTYLQKKQTSWNDE